MKINYTKEEKEHHLKMVLELTKAGLSQVKIKEKLGISTSYICGLRKILKDRGDLKDKSL